MFGNIKKLFKKAQIITNPGYYNEDIWGTVNKELEGKIEQGITLYGEIVGFLASGKFIQGKYDYGCENFQHKFVVYRVTYTKPDGNVIEFNWNQIKNYCKKYSIETVKELYYGKAYDLAAEFLNQPFFADWMRQETVDIEDATKTWQNSYLNLLSNAYLEKDCKYCINKLPAEGIVVRRDNAEGFDVYKLKSKRFILKETEEMDKGVENIEEEQEQTV